jgi:hypothetical protein
MKLSIPIFIAAILSGCMTMGRPFEAGRVTSIQLGKTTDKDLTALFGEPYRTGVEDGTGKSYAFNSNIPIDQAQIKK